MKGKQVIVYTSAGGRMALRPFTEVGYRRARGRVAVWGGRRWWPSGLGCDGGDPPMPDDAAALAWLLEGEVGHG